MSNGIIVLGAGGHAKVVIEILQSSGELVDYCVASGDARSQCLSVEVLAGDDQMVDLYQRGYRRAIAAVGDNAVRQRLACQSRDLGFTIVNAISPHAVISRSAVLGAGVAVMAGVVINAQARIGGFSILNTGATIDHDCVIGAGAHVAPNSTLAGGVRVGCGAFVGAGSVVIPGVAIGENAVVGAGSVVVRDVPPSVVAFGNPARVVSEGSL